MKIILIIFLVISMIVPAFKDDIQKKTPNIAKYIFIHDPDSFSLYTDIFAKNVVIPENDILMT